MLEGKEFFEEEILDLAIGLEPVCDHNHCVFFVSAQVKLLKWGKVHIELGLIVIQVSSNNSSLLQ